MGKLIEDMHKHILIIKVLDHIQFFLFKLDIQKYLIREKILLKKV